MRSTRTLITLTVVATLALGLANVATAARKAERGQELFKEFCKPCHAEGSDNGEYTPMTLIQEQWERFFDSKYVPSHQEVRDPAHGDTPVTEAISADDLELIREFAIDHAADSEHPMTCG